MVRAVLFFIFIIIIVYNSIMIVVIIIMRIITLAFCTPAFDVILLCVSVTRAYTPTYRGILVE